MTEKKGTLPKAYLRLDPNIDQTHPDPGAMVKLLCAAHRQPHRGRFKTKKLMESILGRAATSNAIARRDVAEVAQGVLYVLGWDEWQEGDFTVGERMRRMRARRDEGVTEASHDSNPTVTEPSHDRANHRNADRNGPSEAVDSRQLDREVSTATPVPKPARANGSPTNEPRLTKDQLDAWASFRAPEWQPFKEAWFGRGFLWPPTGDPEDDDTSQRGLLWQVADAQPNNLGRWVREAKGKTIREVIDHVLTQWHEVRADAVDDSEWQHAKAQDRKTSATALTRIGALVKDVA